MKKIIIMSAITIRNFTTFACEENVNKNVSERQQHNKQYFQLNQEGLHCLYRKENVYAKTDGKSCVIDVPFIYQVLKKGNSA